MDDESFVYQTYYVTKLKSCCKDNQSIRNNSHFEQNFNNFIIIFAKNKNLTLFFVLFSQTSVAIVVCCCIYTSFAFFDIFVEIVLQ